MSPAVFAIIGLVLIWIALSGRAREVWNAIFSPTPTGTTQTA